LKKDSIQHPSVFISHASPDSKCALWIESGLRNVGIKAHLDQVEIKAGDNIISWMNKAAGESDYLLILLSPISIDRYWIEIEWSNALMKEAELRRTFVIPAVLPGLDTSCIPFLLKSKLYIDFRKDREKAFLQLVSRLKEDELIYRDLGRFPSPASKIMADRIEKAYPESENLLDIIIHSNRFSRSFRLQVPTEATINYVMGMVRDTLKLKFSNIDETLGVELRYAYYLRHNGEAVPLGNTLQESGIKNGDRLELWIQVTLRDLFEDKELSSKVLHEIKMHYKDVDLSKIPSNDIIKARKRAFSSVDIAHIANKFFEHVDA
jgi:hypothetical protein